MNLRAIAVSFVILWMGACSSGVARKDLDSQENAVRQGNEETVDRLYEKRSKVAESDRPRYVDVLSQAPGEKSSAVLRSLYEDPAYQAQRGPILDKLSEHPEEANAEFIRRKLSENPALYDEQLETYLIQRADRLSAETIFQCVEKGQARLNPAIIGLFGQVGLSRSLPVLQAQADQGKDVEPAIAAIARFGTPEASDYLIQTAGNPQHPARIQAIRHLPGAADQAKARILLHSLLTGSTDSAAITATQDALRDMGYNEESYNLLKQVYAKTENADVRANSVDAMATLRQVDAGELRKELGEPEPAKPITQVAQKEPQPPARDTRPVVSETPHRGLTRAYDDSHRLTDIIHNQPGPERTVRNRQVDQPIRGPRTDAPEVSRSIPAEKLAPRANYRLDESAGGANHYDNQMAARLQLILGADASDVRLKIHNALLTYGESDSSSAEFVHRAYRRGFGVNDERAKELLKRGLHLPRSLETILSAVSSEYSRRDLQVYALSSFFALKRKHAERIIDAHRRGAL